MKKYILILSTLLFVLTACSKTVDVKLEPEVTAFLQAGSDKKINLTEQDPEYILLKEWLAQHQASWLSTSGRYSGGIYLISGEYGIQITESKVVLYSNITDKPTAIYAQEIERIDLKALKDLAK
jgi:hypothetical protein